MIVTNKDPEPSPIPDPAASANPAPLVAQPVGSNTRIQNDAPSVAGTVAKEDHTQDTDGIDADVGARLCPHCGVVLIRGFQDACDKCRDNITPKVLPTRRPCTRCRKHLVCVPDLLCFDCKERDIRRGQGEAAAAMRRAQAPPASPPPTGENGQV